MKNYGSNRKHEKMRPVFFQIGLITSLALCLAAFEWKTLERELPELSRVSMDDIEEIVAVTSHKKEELPAPKPKSVVLFNEVDDDIPLDEIDLFNPEDDQDKELEKWDPELPDENEDERDDDVFMLAQEQPEFPGGYEALLLFLKENIRYPRIAKESNITGTVHLTFVVDKSGEVRDIALIRGIGGGCDEEAMRVVRMMPDWKPGKQRGKPVHVAFNLPVSFKLED